MRRIINLLENEQALDEIEIGGEVDISHFDDIRDHDYRSKQLGLFPELPTMEPDLPPHFEEVGRIGSLFVACKQYATSKNGKGEFSYVLFDSGEPIGYVSVIDPFADFNGRYLISNPKIHGDGLRVVSIFIDDEHRGQNLAVKLYHWLLTNVCDYLLPDDLQTHGGVAIWRKLRNSRAFDVLVYDPDREFSRERWSGKDFNQVYASNRLKPWVTLAGKANQLIDGEDY